MPQDRNLNARFQAHIRRARLIRRTLATSVLCVCLLVGVSLAFQLAQSSSRNIAFKSNLDAAHGALRTAFAPFGIFADETARSLSTAADALRNVSAHAGSALTSGVAKIENLPHHAGRQLAAAATSSWLDAAANKLYWVLCPILRNCPTATAAMTAQRPSNPNQHQTTTFQNVNHVEFPPPAPQTATSVAVSNSEPAVSKPAFSPPAQVIQQPVIGRIRETVVTNPSADTAYIDARIAALAQSLQSHYAPVEATQSRGDSFLSVVDSVTHNGVLTGTDLTDITVHAVDGLTDADIPDDVTASNYLPLSGGTLSGDVSIGGLLDLTRLSGTSLTDTRGVNQFNFGSAGYDGRRWRLYDGSNASPITTAGPTVKISRTESIPTSQCAGNVVATECNAALSVISVGDVNTQVQANSIRGDSLTYSTSASDAVGVQAYGRVKGPGTGTGTGLYALGRRDTDTGSATGAEIRVENNTLTEPTYNTNGNSRGSALWLTTNSQYGTANAVALGVGDINGSQFAIGIGFTQGSIRDTSIRDDSSAHTSIHIKGTHAYSLLVDAGGGSVGVGTSTPNWLLQIASTTPSLAITDTSATANAKHWLLSNYKGTFAIATSSDNLTSTSTIFSIVNSGNVGIGTMTPSRNLEVIGSQLGLIGSANDDEGLVLQNSYNDGNTSSRINFRETQSGNFGFSWLYAGSGSPTIGGTTFAGLGGDTLYLLRHQSNVTGSVVMAIDRAAGNVGIGTTNPGQTLTVAGSVGFPAIATGAGTAYVCETLATGILSTSTTACNPSSLRYKDNVQTLSYGLTDILKLQPVSFVYKPELKVPGNQVGFIAEDVVHVVPEIVGLDAQGRPDNVDYGKLAPLLTKAIQEMATVAGTFKANLVAWLGTAENGISDLFATNLHAANVYADHGTFNRLDSKELCVEKSDGTPVCITGDELNSLLSASVLGAHTASDPAADAPDRGGPPETPAASPVSTSVDVGTSTPPSEPVPNHDAPATTADSEAAPATGTDAPSSTAQ